MCGLSPAGDETLIEGWLRKKSHHLGVWRDRFFKFDGRVLKYWKSRRHAHARLQPKGEIQVTGNHVVPFDECRLVILDSQGRGSQGAQAEKCFDEELMAKSRTERDEWVQCLNGAVVKHRISISENQVSTERLLRSKDLWEVLEEAVTGAMAGSYNTDVQDWCSVSPTKVSESLLAHTRCGSVLLRLSEAALKPRHGRLVVAGRAMLQDIRRLTVPDAAAKQVDSCDERWLLLVSTRNLVPRPAVIGRRLVPYLEEPEGLPVDFEALHVYENPVDDSEPFMSLPLLNCKIGSAHQCEDGHFWAVRIEEEDDTGAAASRVWTVVVETKEDCESWQQALETACKAAQARRAGLRWTIEETLAGFDADPAAWRESMAECLADAGDICFPSDQVSVSDSSVITPARSAAQPASSLGDTAPSDTTSAATAVLERVLCACDEVWCEAEDILDAALQQQPMRRDVCEAVLEAAIDPAVACVGRFWMQWNAAISPTDSRRLLRWLDRRLRSLHSLGVVFTPLTIAVDSLSTELSLRMGRHLRRLTMQLLVRELRAGPAKLYASGGQNSSSTASNNIGTTASNSICATASGLSLVGSSSGSSRAAAQSPATSTLPVDFFTMVFSCLSLDLEQDVLALRIGSQRVAKFVIYEVTEVLLGWLIATQREVAAEVRDRSRSRGSEIFSPQNQQWLSTVAGLANSITMFVSQCCDLNNTPLLAGDFREQVSYVCAVDSGHEVLRREALPFEWSLDSEKKRFEALLEAFLWAAADVVTIRWRSQMLTPTRGRSNSDVSQLLKSELDAPLHFLRDILKPSIFERMLPRVFHVCFGSYLGGISRGNFFQAPSFPQARQPAVDAARDPTKSKFEQFSDQASKLCAHFRNISLSISSSSGTSGPWDSPSVLEWLRVVWSNPGNPQKWRISESGESHSLRNVLAVLSAEPLDLSDVLVRFTGKALAERFEELPPAVPCGGLFSGIMSAARPISRRGSEPQVGATSGSRTARSTSVPKVEPRRSLKLGLFGQPREGSMAAAALVSARGSAEQGAGPRASAPAIAAAAATRVPPGSGQGSGQGGNLLGRVQGARCCAAVEGGVCDLHVEDIGSYGMFCNLGRTEDRAPDAGESGARLFSDTLESEALDTSAVPICRRWVQFARERPGVPAQFKVMRSRPSQVRHSSTLESFTLSQLQKASATETTELELVFLGDQVLDEETTGSGVIRYSLRFDCPSHLFRVKRVLEDWWAPAQLPEKRPIVGLSGTHRDKPPWDTAIGSWGGLQSHLTKNVLEARFGTLWAEVQPQIRREG